MLVAGFSLFLHNPESWLPTILWFSEACCLVVSRLTVWKSVWSFLEKDRNGTTICSSYTTLGYMPKYTSTYGISSYKDVCSSTLIAVQLTIYKKWKHPGSPLVNKWIKKMWYIFIMVCHSDVRKMKFAGIEDLFSFLGL